MKCEQGIIHLAHSQIFPKNYHFLPTDTYKYVCLSCDNKS